MTFKEGCYVALAATVGVVLLLIFRDQRSQELIAGFFRRKSVDDLAAKIKSSIAAIDASLKVDKENLQHEAERYRNMKSDESEEAIDAFYKDLLSKRTK